ncbi:PAS domain S-box protein [Rubellimicrobium rubrum]|uniref:histidine kinase n=2 Tax=Rubellimicrobium rubrum TaxID=2585369 RepID=A0A5C4N3R0_9RHOB|nr:PAS domain S-box protein [Rubellimicrobium rubrum]
MPFVLLTSQGGGVERNPAARRFLDILGNVTFLERPFHPTTLVSLAQSALRGRRRQYEARSRLEALRDSEERYRTLFDSIDEGFCVIEFLDGPHGPLSDYVHLEANPAYSVHAGLADAVGKRVREILPDEAEGWVELYGRVLRTGEPVRFERELVATGRHLELSAFRVEPASRRQVAVLFQDISARKSTEVQLRDSEAALRKLNETLELRVEERTTQLNRLWRLSEDMLARAAFDGMMSAVSPAWTRVLGWTEAELLARPYASFMHPEDAGATLAALTRMAETGEPARYENRIARRDGGWTPIEWTVAPEPDGSNFIAVGRDLSDVRQREADLQTAQEALRQAQKMEAMGQLTGGVAHDFNNLLTPIIGSLDRLLVRGLGTDRERRLMAGALESAERAKTLVQRLLAFARRQPLQATAVDLPRLVQGMADLIGATLGPKIQMRLDVVPDLPPARADANQVEMALLNLAVNARDAMPDGGTLSVAASVESVRGGHRSGVKAGHYIRLSVADTGTGMDKVTLGRAVEPFFSTKGIGKGTGLGLSMVHGLAAQLGGGLTIRSAVGQGTTVELWLPVSSEPIAEAVTASAVASRPSTRGCALLVDDEDLVRMSTADMLVDFGFDVIEAGSAEAALQLIEDGAPFDLLVTDHLMPGMTGAQLAREVKVRRPGLPVLIVSGYAEVDGLAPDLPRLVKPFRAAELAERVASILPDEERVG